MIRALEKHPTFPGVSGPVVVCVMDGVGIGRRDAGDAVFMARTPTLDWLAANVGSGTLAAHGRAVGMPSDEDMGNSEVGHNTLGAGRIFDQGAKLVANAMAQGSLFEGATGEVWQQLVGAAISNEETLHFIGLLSDGNVHSHIEHLFTMLRRAAADGVKRVRLHVLLDGRDVPAQSALDYIDATEELLERISGAADRDYRIASGGGRMNVTMDRYEADWEIVARGWNAHVHGEAHKFPSAREAVMAFRREDPRLGDQFLPAFVVVDEEGYPVGPIRNGASVVLFNFRGDRAIEISRAFEEADFPAFDRRGFPDVVFAGMMEYDGDTHVPKRYLVAPPAIDRTLGEFLASSGQQQLAISETQKFGHVTYFWNGNRSGTFDDQLECYVEIPSDRVPFEQRPWMKSAEITDRLIQELLSGRFQHARVNYANGDMVGHTGHYEATVLSVECLDLQLARLLPVVEKLRGALIVTADHGNADEMLELDPKTGEAKRGARGEPRARTSHSLNPVPFHVYAPGVPVEVETASPLGLAHVAGSVLHLLGYAAPEGYERSPLKL